MKEENTKNQQEEQSTNLEESNIYEALPEVEKEAWIKFHENAYEDDLKHSEKNSIEFPRWSIISGYYAMHDITKLYLGKIHNIKITGEEVHNKTLKALNKFILDKKEKDKIIELLEKAEINFFNAIRLKEKILPLMLRKGKAERGKTQYYSKDFLDITFQKSTYFFDNIVKPYIEIMKGMLSQEEPKKEISKKEQEKEEDKNAA